MSNFRRAWDDKEFSISKVKVDDSLTIFFIYEEYLGKSFFRAAVETHKGKGFPNKAIVHLPNKDFASYNSGVQLGPAGALKSYESRLAKLAS